MGAMIPRSSGLSIVSFAMRYILHLHELEPEGRLRLFRALVAWAMPLCDNFRCMINIIAYDDPAEAEPYKRLGDTTLLPPDNAGLMQSIFRYNLTEPVSIVGRTSPELFDALTTNAAPSGAITGDESPVEDLYLYDGSREVYVVVGYGSDHLLDLTDEELESVRGIIRSLGFPGSIIGPHGTVA